MFTNHVEPFPDTAPFSENKGYFSYHRILQRYHRLEQTLVVDLAWFQVNIGTWKYSLYCAILRSEASVPACKREKEIKLQEKFTKYFFSCIIFSNRLGNFFKY